MFGVSCKWFDAAAAFYPIAKLQINFDYFDVINNKIIIINTSVTLQRMCYSTFFFLNMRISHSMIGRLMENTLRHRRCPADLVRSHIRFVCWTKAHWNEWANHPALILVVLRRSTVPICSVHFSMCYSRRWNKEDHWTLVRFLAARIRWAACDCWWLSSLTWDEPMNRPQ